MDQTVTQQPAVSTEQQTPTPFEASTQNTGQESIVAPMAPTQMSVPEPTSNPAQVPTTPEGYTYEIMKNNNWTDEQLLSNQDYAFLVPENIKQQLTNRPPTQNAPVQEVSQQQEVQQAIQPVPTPNLAVSETLPNGGPDDRDQVLNGAVQNVQRQAETSPLAGMSTYTPPTDQSSIVGEITPANFDNMMKVLKVLIKERSSDNIIIRQSRVKQGASDCVIEADMTTVLNYQGQTVDLDIINPKKYVDLFGQFRSANNVFIVDDPVNNRFIITNGEIRLFLPKQESQLEQEVESIDISNSTVLCTKTIDKDTRKIIKSLAKDQEFVEYLIQDNMLKAMHIPDTAVYVYEEYLNDPQASNLDETNAELTLRSSSFLPVDAEAYDVVLYKLQDGSYASVTDCKIGGQIDVKIIELTDETTGGNLLI